MLQKAEDILRETEFMKERRLINKLMGEIARETGMVVYGLYETLDALNAAAVERLFLSEGIKKIHVHQT